jgi:hypothetical protein
LKIAQRPKLKAASSNMRVPWYFSLFFFCPGAGGCDYTHTKSSHALRVIFRHCKIRGCWKSICVCVCKRKRESYMMRGVYILSVYTSEWGRCHPWDEPREWSRYTKERIGTGFGPASPRPAHRGSVCPAQREHTTTRTHLVKKNLVRSPNKYETLFSYCCKCKCISFNEKRRPQREELPPDILTGWSLRAASWIATMCEISNLCSWAESFESR